MKKNFLASVLVFALLVLPITPLAVNQVEATTSTTTASSTEAEIANLKQLVTELINYIRDLIVRLSAPGGSSTSVDGPIISVNGPTLRSTGQNGTWVMGAVDPQSGLIDYEVSWGDGASARATGVASGSSKSFSHAYRSAGSYTIFFYATDPEGHRSNSSLRITVSSSNSGTNTGSGGSGSGSGSSGSGSGSGSSIFDMLFGGGSGGSGGGLGGLLGGGGSGSGGLFGGGSGGSGGGSALSVFGGTISKPLICTCQPATVLIEISPATGIGMASGSGSGGLGGGCSSGSCSSGGGSSVSMAKKFLVNITALKQSNVTSIGQLASGVWVVGDAVPALMPCIVREADKCVPKDFGYPVTRIGASGQGGSGSGSGSSGGTSSSGSSVTPPPATVGGGLGNCDSDSCSAGL